MMKLDIRMDGNVIGGRQGWAYVTNSMKVPVLEADLDKEQEYGDRGFSTFGEVHVVAERKNYELTITGTLECEKGKWMIGSSGCCLHASFTFNDMMEGIKNANLPTIRKGQTVAIAMYSNKSQVAVLSLYKVGAIDTNCMTVTTLVPLTDEEMQGIKADIERWCDR